MRFNPENVPPGWGFYPTDQQLLSYYSQLQELIAHPNPDFDIKVITLSEYDPWDLLAKFKNNSGGKEMYFFTPCEYNEKTGRRKRKAGSGNWQCSGEPRYITREDGDGVIGTKRTFVFHNPDSTKFIITEYEKLNLPPQGYVLCKLKISTKIKKSKPDCNKARPRKKARKAKISDANQDTKQTVANSANGEGEPSNRMASYAEKQNLNYEIPIFDRTAELIPQDPIVDEIPKNGSFSQNVFDSLSEIYATDDLFDMTAISAYDKDESISQYLVDDPYEKTGNSTFDKAESISILNHQKDEDSYRRDSCFENQNAAEMTANSSHENADTSAPVEGEGNPLMKSPDFDTQNRYEEKDVSSLDNYWSILDPLVGETRLEDTNYLSTFGEINIQHSLEWLEEFLEVKDNNEAPELGGIFGQKSAHSDTVRPYELGNDLTNKNSTQEVFETLFIPNSKENQTI
ncbi:NAC domain-containing protein 96-like [Euphorbia lathyris]|uniref:NAC domain-containing protein 96-like n=1 Tax=Euphorbia lathyris TaxID=212925 RepID=UPI003313A905